jgi:hypothetical protein
VMNVTVTMGIKAWQAGQYAVTIRSSVSVTPSAW